MLTTYYTVKQFGKHEINIQRSRFIAHVKRVTSEEEAQQFIEELKKEHWSANHNCSAYMIGDQNQIQRANDDGEPTGTAGVPMLEVLKQRQLKDTVVVVTRYFGGVKLGAGGLIRAYSTATSEGLKVTGVVERALAQIYKVTFDYPFLGKIENSIHSSNYILKGMEYLDKVSLELFVKACEETEFETWITNLTNGQATIETLGVQYLETDVPF